MTEQELRLLVREAIARHTGGNPAVAPGPSHPGTSGPSRPRTVAPASAEASAGRLSAHASHFLFMVPTGSDADGPCVIEPAVPCTHCGYCRSYGH